MQGLQTLTSSSRLGCKLPLLLSSFSFFPCTPLPQIPGEFWEFLPKLAVTATLQPAPWSHLLLHALLIILVSRDAIIFLLIYSCHADKCLGAFSSWDRASAGLKFGVFQYPSRSQTSHSYKEVYKVAIFWHTKTKLPLKIHQYKTELVSR